MPSLEILLFCCIALSTVYTTHIIDDYLLKHVTIITRHGARTTLHPIPVEPEPWMCEQHFETSYSQGDSLTQAKRRFKFFFDVPNGNDIQPGNCASGQLTTEGEQMHLELGQKWYSQYVDKWDLLSPQYNSTQIHLRSTFTERTMESLQGQLNGMYPDTAQSGAVMRVSLSDSDTDSMKRHSTCQRYDDIQDYIDTTDWVEAWYAEREALFNETCDVLGFYDHDTTWKHIGDNFVSRLAHNMALPPGVTDEMYYTSLDGYDFAQYSQFCAPDLWHTPLIRVCVGKFIGEILQQMEQVIEGVTDYRMRIASGHDTTVGPIMGAIGGDYDCDWPPFAAALQLELLQDLDGNYFVRTIWDDVNVWPGFCTESPCPWNEFVDGLTPFIPEDRDAECDISFP